MTYHTNIRHQELVAILGTRNLYLRLVYAHIANYTAVKGAWCGSQRDLAAQLELPIATVSNQLTELINRGLIVRDANVYRSAGEHPCSDAEHPCSTHEQTRSANEQTRSPHEQKCSADEQKSDPIINNETMKSNEIIARDTIATPDPKDQYSFDRLEKLFMKRTGTFQMAEAVRNDSRSLWEQYPLWKRILLLEELTNPTGQVRPRLDWTLTAFNPQPKFLSGYDQDDYWKSAEWTKNHKPLVMVEYQGAYKVCTEQTMRTFDLKFKRNVLPYND